MTPSKLRTHTCKDLAQMAKKHGVSGWHAMRKEELIRALVKEFKRSPRRGQGRKRPDKRTVSGAPQSKSSLKNKNVGNTPEEASSTTERRVSQLQAKLEAFRNLAAGAPSTNSRPAEDRLVVMVRDPYWLHAYWELNQRSIERAQSALGQNWYSSQPVLRLFRVAEDGAATFRRQIPIHGGVSNWYVDVEDPPSRYRLEIGYVCETESFFCLARSNEVTTPAPGGSDSVDENWADVAENADRIYAMSGGYSPRVQAWNFKS